jgi:3-oxoacyl-[acyl-carrier-protein] synthase II
VNADRNRVVVTGLGAITPVGNDVASTWASLLAGRSGVRRLNQEWARDLPTRIAACVTADLATLLDRRQVRRLDRYAQLALIAAREAWAHAGAPEVAPERLGVVVADACAGVESAIAANDLFREQGWRRLSPFTLPMFMPNAAAAWISIEFAARAGVHATVSACTSGAEAIGYAIDMIRSGRADVVLAGGTDAPVIPLVLGSLAALRTMSTRNDEPERASRPFDKGRDGFVLGEGGAMMVLESAEHARRRGARVHAVAAGVGYSADAWHIAHPDPDGRGAIAAMERALADAGADAGQVVHVNAHGTSAPAGDAAEAKAIVAALGADARRVVVSATKSMTGHLLGGTSALESVACVLALRERVAPPTINLENPDDGVDLEIPAEPRALAPRDGGPMAAINNCFGFGGHNVAIVFTEHSSEYLPPGFRILTVYP